MLEIDTIFWGLGGSYCNIGDLFHPFDFNTYYESGDTIIFTGGFSPALMRVEYDEAGNYVRIHGDKEGYKVGICYVHILEVHNGAVEGGIAPGINSMPLDEFVLSLQDWILYWGEGTSTDIVSELPYNSFSLFQNNNTYTPCCSNGKQS